MRRATWAGVASASLVASATLLGADVWESKPFHTWTDKELEKVLTSSPWAGKASVTYVRSRPQPIQEQAIVTWASAQVIRQALAREEFGAARELPGDVEAIIARTPSFYIVTVKISKGTNPAGHAAQAATMQNETFLQIRGKPPIPAVDADGEIVGQDGGPLQASGAGPVATPWLAQRAGAPAARPAGREVARAERPADSAAAVSAVALVPRPPAPGRRSWPSASRATPSRSTTKRSSSSPSCAAAAPPRFRS